MFIYSSTTCPIIVSQTFKFPRMFTPMVNRHFQTYSINAGSDEGNGTLNEVAESHGGASQGGV